MPSSLDGVGEGILDGGMDSGINERLPFRALALGGDGAGERANSFPSIEPISRIFFVIDLVSTPYMAGIPFSFSHAPKDDVARK